MRDLALLGHLAPLILRFGTHSNLGFYYEIDIMILTSQFEITSFRQKKVMVHGGTLKELLEQLLLIQDVREAVQANGNKIDLRFAADGPRRSYKIGTVMAVLSVLEEKDHGCDHQYTIALYNGKGMYEKMYIFL